MAAVLKDSPTPADAHVPSTDIEPGPTPGRKKKRKPVVPPMLDENVEKLMAALRRMRLRQAVEKLNPNHVPAGSPEGGEFATGDGGSGSGKWTASDRDMAGLWMSSAYGPLNRALRGKEPPTGLTRQRTKQMDQLFAKVPPTTAPTVMYRGLSLQGLGVGSDPRVLLGATLTDDGYASVTDHRSKAEEFASPYWYGEGPGAVVAITVRAGTPMLTPGDLRPDMARGNMEFERVLPRGSRFTITKVTPPAANQGALAEPSAPETWHIEADYAPPVAHRRAA